MRILLIEDDEILADRLLESLTQHQYVVDAIADGQEGLEYAQSATYDLIISDVGLPGIDGITLCSRLRNEGASTPILLMTAKDVPDERIRGLDAGADDYLTKPLNLDELHARVRALLRRGEVAPATVLQAGLLQLDPVSCQVTYGDRLLKLTPKEYSLLELFMRSPNRVFSRSHIIEHLWSFDDPPLEDSVKAHIKGLRRKLKQVGATDWVENVYGIGYRFAPEEAPAQSSESPAHPQTDTSSTTGMPAVPQSTTPSPGPPPTASIALEETFKTSMAGLWSKYQGLITERIAALTHVAEAIPADALTADLTQAGTQAAHKLAGILGMFELDEGSDLARQIETGLESSRPEALASLPALIDQLIALVQTHPTESRIETAAAPGYALLVSPHQVLAEALQNMEQGANGDWHHAPTLAEAETALQQSLPEVVVVDIAAASLWSPSLHFLKQLASYSPAIPALAITTSDSLIDRVEIAQTGVQRLLTQPVTAVQVWEVALQLRQQHRGLTAQILVVDDDPLILKTLRPLLEPWGLGVTGLESPHNFWELLNATQPDLLILDVEMPEFSGIELCQAVRTAPRWQQLPILFLTAHRDGETVQAVFRAGADDYIAKPLVGPELLTRILNRLERNRLLQTLSHRDTVTQLANYSRSREVLTQHLEKALQQSSPFSLAFLQLSDLQSIHFRYGHEVGQTILQTWGQCLRAFAQGSQVPQPELMGYWGRGEFVVGVPEKTQPAAQDALEPLFQTLRRQIIKLPTGERIQPTFTQSIVTFPIHGQTLQALYQSAVDQSRAIKLEPTSDFS